jgi:hypothetical protein
MWLFGFARKPPLVKIGARVLMPDQSPGSMAFFHSTYAGGANVSRATYAPQTCGTWAALAFSAPPRCLVSSATACVFHGFWH